ncbi:MAG: succinylglutamate desuccinylase/aspartoacylase family protein [Alphaproteobacteria bacterium]
MTRSSIIITDIDFDRDGKQVGTLNLPQSPHEDAWGVMPIPIAVIKNGTGPTVLLEGGNHGDEYEGPIILGRMIRDLDPAEIQGRLIMIPAINTPAVIAGQRTSPVDGLNFNRCFPGDPLGTMTQQIAHYVHDVLFELADAFLDLHSGGSSLDILPSAIVEPSEDNPELTEKNFRAAAAFGAPYTVVLNNLGDPRTATASAVRAGLITVGTELGRGGSVSLDSLQIGSRGVCNVLAHLGVMGGAVTTPPPTGQGSRAVRVPGAAGYVYSPAAGVFEPFHEKGARIEEGAEAGLVHFLNDPGRAPVAATYKCSGRLYARRQPGRVDPGNCVGVVVVDVENG